VPAEETVILKGAKTMELAVQKAKKLLKGTTADDWHGTSPVSLLPKAAMDAWRKREQIWQQRARWLSPTAAERYFEAATVPPGWVEHRGPRTSWISPDGKSEISDTGRKGSPQRFQVFFLQNGKRHEDIGWPSLKKALQYLSGEVGLSAHPMAKREGGNLDNFLDGFSQRHPRLGRLLPKVVEKAQGSSSGHGEARQHGNEIWLFPKFWDLDLKIQDFVLAHEIGHYVQSQKPGTWLMNLGKEHGVDVWDTRSLPFGQFNQDEAFADSFASYFLEPGELRRRYPAWIIFVEAAL
jgi:hypothetical protein